MEVAAPNIEAFQTALTQRFKLTVEDFMVMKSRPQFLLCCMNQLASENSEQYYSRNRNLSPALHGCDHDNDTLTPSEISLRSIAVANFVPGLRNDWPRSCTSLKWRFAPTADPPPHSELTQDDRSGDQDHGLGKKERPKDAKRRSRRGSASLPQRGPNRTMPRRRSTGKGISKLPTHPRKR